MEEKKIQGFKKVKEGWECKACGKIFTDEDACYAHLRELKRRRTGR